MELDFKSENGVTVLTMSGRLDSATSGPAEQKISEELSRGGSWIVLMRDLEYVSSAGLRVFLLMAKQAANWRWRSRRRECAKSSTSAAFRRFSPSAAT